MSRPLTHWRVGSGIVIVLSMVLVGLSPVGNAHAQALYDPYGVTVLSGQIQTLQQSINTLQAKIDAFQNATAPRRFYLTPTASFDGSHAPTACAVGFHMANLFEIFDTTNLQYDKNLGFTTADMGEGPPDAANGVGIGWMRTGGTPDSDTIPGVGNCAAYTSAGTLHFGTLAF